MPMYNSYKQEQKRRKSDMKNNSHIIKITVVSLLALWAVIALVTASHYSVETTLITRNKEEIKKAPEVLDKDAIWEIIELSDPNSN